MLTEQLILLAMLLGFRYNNAYSIPLIVIVGVGLGVGLVFSLLYNDYYTIDYVYNYSSSNIIGFTLVELSSDSDDNHTYHTTSSAIPFKHRFSYNTLSQQLTFYMNYFDSDVEFTLCGLEANIVNSEWVDLPFIVESHDLAKDLNGHSKHNTLSIYIDLNYGENNLLENKFSIYYFNSFGDLLNEDSLDTKIAYPVSWWLMINDETVIDSQLIE